jgi:putative transposase
MKKRVGEEQIIGVLKEHAAGGNVGDLCRRHGISQTTLYKWKAKFGGKRGFRDGLFQSRARPEVY